MPILAPGARPRQALRMDADGERLGHDRLIHGQRIRNRVAALFRHHEALDERALELAGKAKEALLPAGVLPALPALVALAASDQRIDGHTLAGVDPRDFRARLQHDSRALVAHDEGILHRRCADASRRVVVHVGATDSDAGDAQQNVARTAEPGRWHFADCDFAEGGEKRCLHSSSSQRILMLAARGGAVERQTLYHTPRAAGLGKGTSGQNPFSTR